MKGLSAEQLLSLETMIPEGCFFLLLVSNRDGTTLDTNIKRMKVRQFLQETVDQLESVQWSKMKRPQRKS